MLQFGEKHPDINYKSRPGAYAVIVRDNCLGLIELPDNYYTFAGGGIDDGESEEESLVREVLEETGYSSQPGEKIISARQYITIFDRKIFLNKICHFYELTLIEKIKEPTESDHLFKWFDLEEGYDLLFEEAQKYALDIYLKKIGSF